MPTIPSVTTYQFANIVVRVTSDLPPFGFLADHLAQFTIPAAPADIEFTFRRVDDLASPPGYTDPLALQEAVTFFSQWPHPATSPLLGNREVREQLRQCMQYNDWCHVELNRHSVTIYDFARHCLTIFFTEHSPLNDTTDRHLGFSLLAPYLAAFNAGMIHSSCVVRGGKAALFIAPDEGGKTTIATHDPQNVVLCDDQNIVRRYGGAFYAHSTPWGRYFDSHASAPLSALFFLEKAPRFRLMPLAPHDAFSRLWPEYHAGYLGMPEAPYTQSVALLRELARRIPAYVLHFAPDDVGWPMIDTAMQAFAHPARLANF